MATAQSNNISKSEQITDQQTSLRNLITNATVWYVGSTPPGAIASFNSYLGGGKNPGGPSTANLTDSLVDASTLTEAFRVWSELYTRVRKFRFHRTGNLSPYDQTQITHMANGYTQSGYYTAISNAKTLGTADVQAGNLVTAAGFNQYLTNLYNSWNQSKDNTITYTYYYCHSNCHSSCHSSTRWRR